MSISKGHLACLIVGAVAGIGGSSFLGSSDAALLKAATTDRTSKFAVASCPVDLLGEREAVFVLDFLNGTLMGGVIDNQTGKYMHRYFRQLNADFKVDPNTPEPEYAIVGTRGNIQGNGVGKGIVHIAEKSSGGMIAYGFNFPNRANPNNVLPLAVLDFIQFRESTN